jgi:hypothetical protein
MAALNWQPVVHRSPARVCDHARKASPGWVLDCDDPADFVATGENGITWYACKAHVQDMKEEP